MTKKQMCRAYYAAKCKVTALHISFHLQYFIIFPILQTIKSEGVQNLCNFLKDAGLGSHGAEIHSPLPAVPRLLVTGGCDLGAWGTERDDSPSYTWRMTSYIRSGNIYEQSICETLP